MPGDEGSNDLRSGTLDYILGNDAVLVYRRASRQNGLSGQSQIEMSSRICLKLQTWFVLIE